MFHIERDGHHSNYTCISNAVLRDERLSFEVMAFMVKILSLPDDWSFSVKGIAKICRLGDRTVYRYFSELERCGYLRKERIKDERGCFVDTSYFFSENPVAKNDSSEQNPPAIIDNTEQPPAIFAHTDQTSTTEPFVPPAKTEHTADYPSAKNPHAESDTQINNNIILNNKRSDLIDQQINGDILREEYGKHYIDKVVEVITDCMKTKSRTVSGESVDNAELMRVFGEVCEEDIRRAIGAVKGKSFDNFAGYFGSVLFNQIRSRLDKPQLQPNSDRRSSIQMDEVMRSVLEKYRGVMA